MPLKMVKHLVEQLGPSENLVGILIKYVGAQVIAAMVTFSPLIFYLSIFFIFYIKIIKNFLSVLKLFKDLVQFKYSLVLKSFENFYAYYS